MKIVKRINIVRDFRFHSHHPAKAIFVGSNDVHSLTQVCEKIS